jgi:hypothetical protein
MFSPNTTYVDLQRQYSNIKNELNKLRKSDSFRPDDPIYLSLLENLNYIEDEIEEFEIERRLNAL